MTDRSESPILDNEHQAVLKPNEDIWKKFGEFQQRYHELAKSADTITLSDSTYSNIFPTTTSRDVLQQTFPKRKDENVENITTTADDFIHSNGKVEVLSEFEMEIHELRQYVRQLESRLMNGTKNDVMMIDFKYQLAEVEAIAKEKSNEIERKLIEVVEKDNIIEEQKVTIQKLEETVKEQKSKLEESMTLEKIMEEKLWQGKLKLKKVEESLEASSLQLALTIQELLTTKENLKHTESKIIELQTLATDLANKNIDIAKESEMKMNKKIVKYADLQIKYSEVEEKLLELLSVIKRRDDHIQALEMKLSQLTRQNLVSADANDNTANTGNSIDVPRSRSDDSDCQDCGSSTTTTVSSGTSVTATSSLTQLSATTCSTNAEESNSHQPERHRRMEAGNISVMNMTMVTTALEAQDTATPQDNQLMVSMHRNEYFQTQNIIEDLSLKVIHSEKIQASLAQELGSLRSHLFQRIQGEDVHKISLIRSLDNLIALHDTVVLELHSRFNLLGNRVQGAKDRLSRLFHNVHLRYNKYTSSLKSKIECLENSVADVNKSLELNNVRCEYEKEEKYRFKAKVNKRDDQVRNLIRILRTNERECEHIRFVNIQQQREIVDLYSLLVKAAIPYQPRVYEHMYKPSRDRGIGVTFDYDCVTDGASSGSEISCVTAAHDAIVVVKQGFSVTPSRPRDEGDVQQLQQAK